jgi:hypothetical protein
MLPKAQVRPMLKATAAKTRARMKMFVSLSVSKTLNLNKSKINTIRLYYHWQNPSARSSFRLKRSEMPTSKGEEKSLNYAKDFSTTVEMTPYLSIAFYLSYKLNFILVSIEVLCLTLRTEVAWITRILIIIFRIPVNHKSGNA